MRKLLFLVLLVVGALAAYNYNAGRDLFQLPGTSAAALKAAVRASAGVHTAKNRAEEAVSAAALTSKIKAKMALDDVVKTFEALGSRLWALAKA